MPRHLISGAHEWTNATPTVPTCGPAKPQPGERAWRSWRGKKTLLSLTLTCAAGRRAWCRQVGGPRPQSERPPHAAAPRSPPGQAQAGSLTGAVHPAQRSLGVLRWTQRGRKPRVEHKGKGLPHARLRGRAARNRGLEIPRTRTRSGGGGGKVTTGITGLRRPSVLSDAAF